MAGAHGVRNGVALPRDVPSIAVLGNVVESPAEIVQVAREAEQEGWPAVWMIEYEYDSFAFAEAIALSTSEIVTGSCITRSFTRHPLLVAETATVIDRLAPGRFVVGLGTGGVSEPEEGTRPETRAVKEVDPGISLQRWGTPSDHPAARMREYVEIVRLAQSSENLRYDGEFFRFEDITPSLTPTRSIPIFLGARRERMLRLLGEAADGSSAGSSGRRRRDTRSSRSDRVRTRRCARLTRSGSGASFPRASTPTSRQRPLPRDPRSRQREPVSPRSPVSSRWCRSKSSLSKAGAAAQRTLSTSRPEFRSR